MIQVLPLVALVLAVGILLAPAVNRRSNLIVTRLALSLFGEYVADESPRKQDQRELLRAAHAATTHRVYASKTLLYAGTAGIAGAIIGTYLAAGVLYALEVGADRIEAALPTSLAFLADLARLSTIGAGELFVLLLFFSGTIGAALSISVYYVRWFLLDQRAHTRGARIDATLPRTVAFVYALSRSGMTFPTVMDTLAENEDVYGEAATELGVAVRDMNTFGTDVLTALRRVSHHTPSENLEEFAENLASVLGSGRSISAFLNDQYERYQEESEAQQEQYLELLSTFAEAYVTVLVAGPLFFITILVVVGLVIQDTVPILQIVVYAGIPLASIGFIVYVDSVTQPVDDATGSAVGDDADDADAQVVSGTSATTTGTRSDGGGIGISGETEADRWQANRERLERYDRFQRFLGWIREPKQLLLWNPLTSLAVTVPLALVWIWSASAPIPTSSIDAAVRGVDDAVVQSTTFVLAVYAVLYEIQSRRTSRIEAAVPDFLDRLASINEAGMTVVESLERVQQSDLDDLTPELERTWRDIEWGSDAESALYRMERRIKSPLISRSVALIVNAMQASGDIAPVLNIAADEARATRQLRRERKQVMLTYLIVIYISFLVFLGIIASLTLAFIPAIEQAGQAGGAAGIGGGGAGGVGGVGGGVGGIAGGLGDANIEGYELIFYHAAVIQGICSGMIAGQLGEGDLRDGVKHAVILLGVTYVSAVAMGLI
ncbi:flagellar protein FlaJ [Halopenitus malekzadehii]|uniref:Flagellar protein FlaJ n=1 Tax=Halopenitus malekzadehii TaxID=1267564 RepID=A0A1H6I370_9EURY|nr:type II secretion system F family protein [Halopenitus malekzadehii]SEH41108.1 flagellar protein FlaJ [Halopenitus malekzadehii]